jgi:hypothetical protein
MLLHGQIRAEAVVWSSALGALPSGAAALTETLYMRSTA